MDKINLDELFHQAKTETPKVSFQETKAQFTHSVSKLSSASSANGTSSLFTIKTWTIMITTLITAIGIGSFLLMPNSVQKEISTNSLEQELENSEQEIFIEPLLEWVAKIESEPEKFNKTIVVSSSTEELVEENKPYLAPQKPIVNTSVKFVFVEKQVTNEAYHFPTLTEKEIKANHKQKLKMIKPFAKNHNLRIPSGTVNLNGRTVSVQAFKMQASEVSNLEYRTFLFDLLIQGRKDDFLIAKPDQSQWVKNGTDYPAMETMYFSHPSYNNYPINNISRKGAEMYCKWLTKETNKYLEKKGKSFVAEVRLPTNTEWTFAAMGAMKKSNYPWGGPEASNKEGCYLANFEPKEGKDADGGFGPVAVYSYSPNDYGLYCMAGNMAEMVYYSNDVNQPGARGGSWTSTAEEIKINGEDKFKGVTTPNVNIGFRVVVSYQSLAARDFNNMDLSDKMGSYDTDGKFQFPQLTEKEEKYYAKSKKQIISKAGDYNNKEFVLFQRDTLLFDQDSMHFKDISIQSTEVTNLEYRTFLIGLLEQGKKKEYLEALPDIDVWRADTATIIMSKIYFPYIGYDDYPVVGVTPKGVAMYCEWYSMEIEKYFNFTPPEILLMQIRIPTVKEWEAAASDNGKYKLYPWVGESITDANGKYLANCYPKEGNYSADGTFLTSPVKGYPASSKYLYGMSGNVSEITIGESNTIVLKGGSWKSTPKQIQIYSSHNYANNPLPNSETGFRPVLVYTYHYSIEKYKDDYPTKK